MARRSNEESFAGRDIGPVPKAKDPVRRAECRDSLELFCRTYNAGAFSLPFASIHRECIARIEEAVRLGALYAFAMPRGSGKTTICRMAVLWAASYALSRYVFLIGATAGKASDSLDSIKMFMRFLPEYVEDFPEISYPVSALGGIAHKASGQHSNSTPTMITWSRDRVVLPTIIGDDGAPVPTSGVIIGVSGLTGEGIRGSVYTTASGRQERPSLVLLDDPQTDESARSVSQNESRMRLISNAVLGMAGPGQRISAVMPCTKIADGDMASQVLDREQSPLWRGTSTRMMESMPSSMDEWDAYFEVYRHCMLREPPDLTIANRYYIEHREALDAGAVPTWEDRKHPDEVSAVQHAMHLYCRDPAMFAAEYQNEPLVAHATDTRMTVEALQARTVDVARAVIPDDVSVLTASIDVSEKCLWYTVTGITRQGFRVHIVDHGIFPGQNVQYATLSSVRRTIRHLKGGCSYEVALEFALSQLVERLAGGVWSTESNKEMRINMILVDSGWSTDTIFRFCRRSPFANILLPSKGVGVTASRNPLVDPAVKRKPNESLLGQWRISSGKNGVRFVLFDTNHWKTFVANRAGAPVGSPGSLSIHAGRYDELRMLYEQMTSEYSVRTEGRGRTVDEWREIPNRDNHLWDALCGACVAGSVMGCVVSERAPPKRKDAGDGADKPKPKRPATVTYL